MHAPALNHRALHERRILNASIPDGLTTTSTDQSTATQPADGNSNGNSQNTGGNVNNNQGTTHTTPTTHTTSTTTTTSQPDNNTKGTTTTTHSTSSGGTSTSTHTTTKQNTANTNTLGNSNLNTGLADDGTGFSSGAAATISSSGTPDGAAGNINVAAVIGGVAGGIACVALFFFVIMWFIRRRRNTAEEEFEPSSFRKSAVMVGDSDPFNPRPPTMIERKLNSHNIAPSMSDYPGGNFAGAGAYSAHGHGSDEGHNQYDYAQPQGIQARQQYTYGQTYDHNAYGPQGSDHGHEAEYNGAYSAEPQAQDIYAAEAYAYPNEVVVSPGMQSQEMGHYREQQHDAYGGM